MQQIGRSTGTRLTKISEVHTHSRIYSYIILVNCGCIFCEVICHVTDIPLPQLVPGSSTAMTVAIDSP